MRRGKEKTKGKEHSSLAFANRECCIYCTLKHQKRRQDCEVGAKKGTIDGGEQSAGMLPGKIFLLVTL